MRLFPKTLLRWKEPRGLQLEGYEEGKRSLRRMTTMVLLASLPIIWLTHRLANEATGRVCLALALVLAFMYFVLWVYGTFPSWVTLSEKGISQSVTSEDEQTWKFEAMRQCEIVTRHVGGTAVRMLVIETRQGDRASVGIADSVSSERLESMLTDRGVKVIRNAEPEDPGDVVSRRT